MAAPNVSLPVECSTPDLKTKGQGHSLRPCPSRSVAQEVCNFSGSHTYPLSEERIQQEWTPVLRPNARQIIDWRAFRAADRCPLSLKAR
jgi:hypothetical protein